MNCKFSLAAVIAGTFLVSAAHADDGLYGSLKIIGASQSLSDLQPYSPRARQMISGPNSDRSAFQGSLALGYALPSDWRVEAEYTTPKKSNFDSYWTPFSANVQRMNTSSQRMMINGYKDFPMNDSVSIYGSAGLGFAKINADGYQGNPRRSFERESQTNFSYSVGFGIDYHVNKTLSVGVGYRYVDMGKVKTGYNAFDNVAHARDERLNGKLTENNIFLELRSRF